MSQRLSTHKNPKVLVVFTSPYLYGMERGVIEIFSAVSPDVEPHFLMSETTRTFKLPVLEAVIRSGLTLTFLSDRKGWPRPGKPQSILHLWKMIVGIALGNLDVIKASSGCDIIYLPSVLTVYFSAIACILFRIQGKRVIYHFHDLTLPPGFYSLSLRLVSFIATDFVHNTHLSKNIVAANHKYMRNKKNVVIPYITNKRQNGEACHFENEFQGKRNIVFAGQVSFHKGIDILVRAFELLSSTHTDITLHIIGGLNNAHVENWLHKVMETLQTPGSIRYWGYREDIHLLLKMAYVYVHPSPPSIFQESFGRGVVEAMSVGTPTICFRSGALQEIVIHEETGLICNEESPECIAESLRRLLDNPELRESYGQNALERYQQKYSSFRVRQQWLDFLRNE